MDIMLEEFNPDYVQLEIDTFWVQSGGQDPVKWIEKIKGDPIEIVHLKDYRIRNDNVEFSEIGNGNLDWVSILKTCQKRNVNYIAVEQDTNFKDPMESLNISVKYIKELGY